MEYRLRVYLYHLGILERKHGKLGVSTGTIRNDQILQNRQIDAIYLVEITINTKKKRILIIFINLFKCTLIS